ncbi:hypothetical protein [uncultured Comamonas sp.]|uniref:hypothetical protein n=1 Tax=uncultured Comamonas sp. TaxID=114710 RepID=UPI0025CDE7BE|nr:hypothetical protein [uncultured Comamonas sp.]
MNNPWPYLTDAEINEICSPLKNGAAQIRFLERLGMVVKPKPSGRPLLARAEFDRVMTGTNFEASGQVTNLAASTPNVIGLQSFFQQRKHGTRT